MVSKKKKMIVLVCLLCILFVAYICYAAILNKNRDYGYVCGRIRELAEVENEISVTIDTRMVIPDGGQEPDATYLRKYYIDKNDQYLYGKVKSAFKSQSMERFFYKEDFYILSRKDGRKYKVNDIKICDEDI